MSNMHCSIGLHAHTEKNQLKNKSYLCFFHFNATEKFFPIRKQSRLRNDGVNLFQSFCIGLTPDWATEQGTHMFVIFGLVKE